MITRENLNAVLGMLSEQQLEQCLDCDQEFVLVSLHICNASSFVSIRFSYDPDEFEAEEVDGNLLINTDELIRLLEEGRELFKQFKEERREL